MTPLRITTDVDQDGVAIVGVEGELRRDTAGDLTVAITATLGARHPTHLVVDLARVPMIDIAAVDALLDARSDVQRAGATFRVIRAQPPVRRVLDATGTCRLLTGAGQAHGRVARARRPPRLALGR